MTTTELKQQILSKSFGGIMYDVTSGSAISQLVLDNDDIANVLVEQITSNQASNGIDKGVANFITEVIAKDMVAEAYKKGHIDGSIEVVNNTCELCHTYPMTVDCNNAGCDK